MPRWALVWRNLAALVVLAIATFALSLLPSPVPLTDDSRRAVRAEVLSVDNSSVNRVGLLDYGTQRLTVRLADGSVYSVENELRAQMDLDKSFTPGDTALVLPPTSSDKDEILIARDHWRLGWAALLFGAFAVLLAVFGSMTGVKALMSFVFSCLAVWKLLVPLVLSGYSAAGTTFLTVAVLTIVIIFLVAGLTRKGVAAVSGSLLGVLSSLVLAHVFTRLMLVNGATMPFAPALVYGGYSSLDLQDVFVGAIILASSGAVMDLGIDIASGLEEVHRHNPNLTFRALFFSGLRIGRAVVGTMTTTLLLAYSGGYLTLLMAFAAQGTHPVDFLNSTLVSAEVVKTLVGSFGLVLVAPFTALVGAILFTRRQ